MTPLFDHFVRTDPIPAINAESIFDGLNRLSWKNANEIRNLLETWYESYSIQNKKSFISRLRSKRNEDYQGAFFELFLHQLLIKMGFKVKVDPLIGGGNTPDFHAQSVTEEPFYLEARVVDPQSLRHSTREELVFDELNKLHSPDFMLDSQVRGKLTSNPRLKEIRAVFQSWIDQLDPQTINENGYDYFTSHSKSFQQGTRIITLRPVALDPGVKVNPVSRPFLPPVIADFVDSKRPIIGGIQEKPRRYKNLDRPLIVAINSLDLSGVSRSEILSVLFGNTENTGHEDSARIIPSPDNRNLKRVWSPSQNTNLSAIILFNELQPNSITQAPFCLYENPWAAYSIPSSLRNIPHAKVEGEIVNWYKGNSASTVLGISETWPGSR
jgi:hypothetical protein